MTVFEQVTKVLDTCHKNLSFVYEQEDMFSKLRTMFRANNIKDYEIDVKYLEDCIEVSIYFGAHIVSQVWDNTRAYNKF